MSQHMTKVTLCGCVYIGCLCICVRVSAVYERMRVDQKKFGKSAWAAAVERMERLQYAVSKETLQLMRAKEICLEQKKHSLKEEVTHTMTHTHASHKKMITYHRRRPRCDVCVTQILHFMCFPKRLLKRICTERVI